MFQSILATGLTPLSNINNEVYLRENNPFTVVWPNLQQNSREPEITKTIKKKKKKRVRTAFTIDQLRALEKTFIRFRYIEVERRRELAATLNISEKTIKVWFQNRRMREKKGLYDSSGYSSNETLNVTPPPYFSPMVNQVDSTSFHQYNSDGVLITYTPAVDSYQQTYDQLYQPTLYQNNDHQITSPTNTTCDSNTNVYPALYYPNAYNGYFSDQYAAPPQTNQSNNEQDWLENFDLGYY